MNGKLKQAAAALRRTGGRVWANRLGKIVVTGGVALALFGGGGAVAATTIGANAVGSTQIRNGDIWGVDVHPLTIGKDKLGWDLQKELEATKKTADEAKSQDSVPGTDGKSYGCDGAVVDAEHPAAKCPGAAGADSTVAGPAGPAGPAGDPASDVLGKGIYTKCSPKVIEHIGGSFKTGKTKLCEFTLPAGVWMLNSSAFFSRTIAGAEGTRPQLALRKGASETEFGDDYGTILGAEISPSKDRELTGSAVKVVAGGTVEVFAFGYNDDGSSAGSGEIAVAADIAAVRVG